MSRTTSEVEPKSTRIKFSRMNFETECYHDIINNRGFLITETPFSDVDKTIRNMGGPRSPLYGTTYGDNNEFMDRYHCKCGKYIGAMFEGEECPECHTKIEFTDVDIMYTGWLNLTPYKLINPIYYLKLQSALSRKNLENIIANDNIIDSNGIIRQHSDLIEVKRSMLAYHNIGLQAFYEHYEEIMLYYKTKRKPKADLIDQLIEAKDLVWTSKIPVYSTVLRPQGVTSESYYFSPIDKQVHPLTNISINLKTANEIEVPLYLYQAQQRINELWTINFSLINGKYGWPRSNVIGGCFNYSGRNVIVLDTSLKIDEVDVPYQTFIVMYSGQIIREIRADKGWTMTKAYNYLKSKFKFDPYVYSLIKRIIAEQGAYLLLNRNPTLTLGSILLMRIRDAKTDDSDLTTAVPSSILPGMNADFDGDELNKIGMQLPEIRVMFAGLSPINMLINRVDETIKMGPSALENISLAILSDIG